MRHLLQNSRWKSLAFTFCCAVIFSCCDNTRTVKEYEAWINEPEQGLRKSRDIDGLEITLKYIPSELLVYKELQQEESKAPISKDSLRLQYKNSLTFLMTFTASDTSHQGRDVMMRDVASQQDLVGRMMTMNFDLGEMLSLSTPAGTIRPVLTHLEGSYGMRRERQMVLAFTDMIEGKRVLDADTIDIAFIDKVFDTGIHHFMFETSDLRSASELFPSDSIK